MKGGLFIPLTEVQHRQVLNKVTSQGYSPDSDGVRAFLLAEEIPPRPSGREPLLHLAIHTLTPLIKRNLHQV